jgi:hypothetical protein
MADAMVTRFNGSRLEGVARRSRKARDVGAEKLLPTSAKGPPAFFWPLNIRQRIAGSRVE